MDRAEACREMTFEEEVALYQKEAKAIFEKEDVGCEVPPINHTVRRGMRIIRKALEEITALREQVSLENGKQASEKKTSDWISVSERLPEEDVDVLTRRATGIDVEHYMGNGKWWNDYYSGRWTVTHWMPLPEPPEEGG